MKLLLASSVLLAARGATAKLNSRRNEAKSYARSIAGLQALQKLSEKKGGKRALQMFDPELMPFEFDNMGMGGQHMGGQGMGGPMGRPGANACGDKCTDDSLCSSFMMASDLEATCSAGCVPRMATNMCKQVCGDAPSSAALDANAPDAALDASAPPDAVTAEQRQGFGFLDAAMDMACGNCKFYECCTSDGTATYDACKVNLPDPDSFLPAEGWDFLEDWEGMNEDFDWDSVLPEDFLEDWEGMDGGFDWDSVLPEDWPEDWNAPPGVSPANPGSSGGMFGGGPGMGTAPVGGGTPGGGGGMFGGGRPGMGSTPGGGTSGGMPGGGGGGRPGGWGWNASGPSGTDSATGLSPLGMVVDSLECSEACTRDELCDTIFSGAASRGDIEDACDFNCLPTVSSCDQFCPEDGSDNMVCGPCKFLACCGKGEAAEGKFDNCQEFFPNLETLLDAADLNANQGGFGPGAMNLPAMDLGGLFDVDLLSCPGSCADNDLCGSFLMSMGDRTALAKTCDANCLPEVTSCDQVCGNQDGPEYFAPMIDMACDTCQFLKCCATGTFEDDCEAKLPDMAGMGSLFPGMGMGWPGMHHPDHEWNHTNWGLDDMDWLDIEEALGGLSDLVDGLHTMIDESLFDLDFSSITCNADTCPINGVCDMSLDLSSVNFDDACASNAFFLCLDGLEAMCTSECGNGGSDSFLGASFCSLCDVATCCKSSGDSATFESCTQDITGAIEAITGPFDDLTTLIEGVVGDASVPEFCPEGNECPIEGFCDIFDGNVANFDISTIEYEQACAANALFLCGPEGFEQMCADKCSTASLTAPSAVTAEARMGGDFAVDMFCSLCDIAKCCENKDASTTFEDCALGAVPQEIADVIESVTEGDGSPSAPVEEETINGNGAAPVEEDTPVEDSPEPGAEADGEPTSSTLDDSNSDALDAAVDPEVAASESPPIDDPTDPVLSSVERTESSNPDSGSGVLGARMCIALASVATMLFASL